MGDLSTNRVVSYAGILIAKGQPLELGNHDVCFNECSPGTLPLPSSFSHVGQRPTRTTLRGTNGRDHEELVKHWACNPKCLPLARRANVLPLAT